jgi:hypothetical protein
MQCVGKSRMDCDKIVQAFSVLPGFTITTSADLISVYLPGIKDSAHVLAREVRRARTVVGPNGENAVELAVGKEYGELPLIFTLDDVVFAPAKTEAVLDSDICWNITDAPPLVTYLEMQRDAERVARACEKTGQNLDRLGASVLLVRCFILGAAKFGMRRLKAVAWWQRGWRAIGEDIPLPPIRQDPLWEEMVQNASRIEL